MATKLILTSGVVWVRSFSGTLTGGSFAGDTFTSTRDNIVITSTDGFLATNTTAATGAVTVQMSPRLRFRGNAWDTAASKTVDFFLENLPATAATPTGTLKFGYSLNGAAASYPMTLSSAGAAILAETGTLSVGKGSAVSAGFVGDFVANRDAQTSLGIGNSTSGTAAYARFVANSDAQGLSLFAFSSAYTTSNQFVQGHQLVAAGSYLDLSSGGNNPIDFWTNGAKTSSLGTNGFGVYGTVTTAGKGVPAIYGYGDVAAATNTGTASIATYTVGAADGTFEVSANCLVTTSTTHSFSLDVTYTDESDVARTLILPVAQLAGAFITGGLITNVTGAGPYEATVLTIRAKATTAITVRTSAGGTYTDVVYNARGVIKQIS